MKRNDILWMASLTLMLLSACRDGGKEEKYFFSDSPTAPKPSSIPYARLFSSESPFNQALPSNPSIDINSDLYIARLMEAQKLLLIWKQYSAPFYFPSDTTPRYDVVLTCGPVWELGVSKLLDVPIPDWAEPSHDIDGSSQPVIGCGEGSQQDNNMIIIDLNDSCEYDLWQARKKDGVWYASWGNSIKTTGTGIYTKGLSSRASGFAFSQGVIWPQELLNDSIPHALAISYPFTRSGGPVSPATESDGITNSVDALPLGARLQLDPMLDLDSLNLTPYERTIARAMQIYGIWLVDTGGESGIGLYAIDPKSANPNPYGTLLPEEDYIHLSGIPLNRFRVLTLPAQIPNPELTLQSYGCASFE
jgi:hypothetical protein